MERAKGRKADQHINKPDLDYILMNRIKSFPGFLRREEGWEGVNIRLNMLTAERNIRWLITYGSPGAACLYQGQQPLACCLRVIPACLPATIARSIMG